MQLPPDVQSRFATDLISLPVLAALGLLATTVIGALATAIVKIIGALHDVAVTVAKVEVSVNSEKTAAQGRLDLAHREVALLREMNEEKKTAASLLAQSLAQTVSPLAPAGVPVPVEIVPTVGQPVPVEVVPAVTDDPKP